MNRIHSGIYRPDGRSLRKSYHGKVNDAIRAKYPHVNLIKGKGYFYISSLDKEVGLKIAGLYQTGIYVNGIKQLTPEQWVKEVDKLFGSEEEIDDLEDRDNNGYVINGSGIKVV